MAGGGSPLFRSVFFCSAFLAIALTASPRKPARPLVAPSEEHFHGGGLAAPLLVKGDGQKTHSRAEKKDHENKYTEKIRAREQIRTVEQ